MEEVTPVEVVEAAGPKNLVAMKAEVAVEVVVQAGYVTGKTEKTESTFVPVVQAGKAVAVEDKQTREVVAEEDTT